MKKSTSRYHRSLVFAACVFVAGFALQRVCAGVPESTITVSEAPRQPMIYGMDFERMWYWDALKEKELLAKLAVQECRVQYVRVGISCGAELEEGQLNWGVYDKALACTRMLQAANPQIRFFASPQPLKVSVRKAPWTCFPMWITRFDKKGKAVGVDAEKAAGYLIRQVCFLRSQGLDIAWLDTKNECKGIGPADIAPMVHRIRNELGDETPLIICPSDYSYFDGVRWVEGAVRHGLTNFFDIAACHNTGSKGSPEAFAAKAHELGVPAWNTELHRFWGPDDVAALNSTQIWSIVRAGFSGMNQWCSLGNEKKTHKMFRTMNDGSLEVMRTYFIYKQLVNTSGGGNYIETSIPEGITTTAAFIKGDIMTVWALNANDKPVDSALVKLSGHRITGSDIKVTSWGPDNPREGSREGIVCTSSGMQFKSPLAARTLYCFEFKVSQ